MIILKTHSETINYLDIIGNNADSQRNELGFFPRSVYEEFCRKNNIYVLISEDRSTVHGHLIFQRKYPRCHIIQMYISPNSRRSGYASELLKELLKDLTHDGFISVYARVAEDLIPANSFWQNQNFYIQRIEDGGHARRRRIIIRCHELSSPQLFPPSGINASNPLGLNTASTVIPVYLVDLNVLYDVAPRRLRRDSAAALFHTERLNSCRLAISDEAERELQRTATVGRTDHMEAYISMFPTFQLKENEFKDELLNKIRSLVFPDTIDLPSLNPNQASDIAHLATVIQHDLAGFITSDGAILNASEKIRKIYNIDILSPDAFKLPRISDINSAEFENYKNATLSLYLKDKNDEEKIKILLTKIGLSGSEISSSWLTTNIKPSAQVGFYVCHNESAIGYIVWNSNHSSNNTTVKIAIDETNEFSTDAVEILLNKILNFLSSKGPHQICLELPSNQSLVREIANKYGFKGTSNKNTLSKLSLSKVITKHNWHNHRDSLLHLHNLKLPDYSPEYNNIDQYIEVLTPDGNKTHIRLFELESLLSPSLFCLPNRPAVITPINSNFANSLLGYDNQLSLLPQHSASTLLERCYISNIKTLKKFSKGSIIFFYETTKNGGMGAIIAVARVINSYSKSIESIDDTDLKNSVLKEDMISLIGKSNQKSVTNFDNLIILKTPVRLSFLKKIGCGRPNDLITTKSLSESHKEQILNEAFRE